MDIIEIRTRSQSQHYGILSRTDAGDKKSWFSRIGGETFL